MEGEEEIKATKITYMPNDSSGKVWHLEGGKIVGDKFIAQVKYKPVGVIKIHPCKLECICEDPPTWILYKQVPHSVFKRGEDIAIEIWSPSFSQSEELNSLLDYFYKESKEGEEGGEKE